MRRFLFGVVLPILLWIGVVAARVAWKYDVHPLQWQWNIWALSLSASAFGIGVGCARYWINQPQDCDKVQLAADESVSNE